MSSNNNVSSKLIIAQAHWIRNQDTEQFRAVNSLQALRRWCLTGTPIQNRLEDLVALLRFLRIEPYCWKNPNAIFKSTIMDSFFNDPKDPCRNLRILLQSICLRRTSQRHSTLTSTCEIIRLNLSAAERQRYDSKLEQVKRDMDDVVSSGRQAQRYTKLFTLILRLRMLCNHGTHSLTSSLSPSRSETPEPSMISELQIEDDTGCHICNDLESSDLVRESDICLSCGRPLRSSPGSSKVGLEATPRKRAKLPSAVPEMYTPINGSNLDTVLLHKTPHGFQDSMSGYSTKLRAVAEELSRHASESKRSFN